MKSNKAVVKMMEPQTGDESIAPLVEEMLGRLGEDPKRDGLARTPERVDKALRFLTSGYRMNIEQILNGALYEVKYDEMVVVRDIEFFSLCEHHMLPFYGKMHVAYLPQKKVIGLSKIPRIDRKSTRLNSSHSVGGSLPISGHRVLQPVRAPHAAVLRQDARGLPATEEGDRAEQDSAHRGHVRAAAADSGAADAAGGADGAGSHQAAGSGSDLRSAPLLHDDAGCGEAALGSDDERHAGGVPGSQGNAGRVSGAAESPDERVLRGGFSPRREGR